RVVEGERGHTDTHDNSENEADSILQRHLHDFLLLREGAPHKVSRDVPPPHEPRHRPPRRDACDCRHPWTIAADALPAAPGRAYHPRTRSNRRGGPPCVEVSVDYTRRDLGRLALGAVPGAMLAGTTPIPSAGPAAA